MPISYNPFTGDFDYLSTGATGGSLNLASDSGTAVPSSGIITIAGGTGINTSASGSTLTITSTATGTVTSVSGTTNRVSSTGGTTPVIDIDAAYVGQSSITTLGTITTGTWNADTIGETFGGTGQSTYATGDVLYASSSNTLSKLAAGTNGDVLTLAAGVPSWDTPTVGTVTSVSGTASRITSTGGSTPVIDISASYVGQSSITTLGTIGTGVWNGTAITEVNGGTGQTTYTTGDILYASASNTLSKLAIDTNGDVLTLVGGVPAWATPSSGGVTSVSGTASRITSTGGTTPVIDIDASYVGQSSITTLGTITTGTWTGTAIAEINGGTNQTSYATGDILYASSANTLSKLTAGSNTNVLTLAGGVPTWAAASGGGGDVSGGGSSTDNALVRWDGASGDTIQDSGYIYGDAPSGYAGSEEYHIKSVVQTTNATATDLVQIPIVEDRVIAIESRIAVIESDHTTFDSFFVQCAFSRQAAGNVSVIGTEVINAMDGSTLDVTVVADTGNQEATIQVTGVAATTYNWVAYTTYHLVNTDT